MNRTEVLTRKDGETESRHLCRLAQGELFFSAGTAGVTIICLGKPADGDLVRQIVDMLKPLPKAKDRNGANEGDAQARKSFVRMTKSVY